MAKYDVHPGVAMVAKWVADLSAKTGRTLEQWSDVCRKLPQEPRKANVAVLKSEYGLGTVTAEQIYEFTFAHQTWDGDPVNYLRMADEYVAGQYAGAKAALFPIFETVVSHVRTLGKDVKVCPCKTIVPFYRTRVFAQISAPTRTRVELAFVLGEVPFDPPLLPNPKAKGNDRLRHLMHLAAPGDFNAAAKKWLAAAYKADA